jgi:hypothetical protein
MEELAKDLERLNLEDGEDDVKQEQAKAMQEAFEFKKLDAQLAQYMRELENDLNEESKEDPIEARLRQLNYN